MGPDRVTHSRTRVAELLEGHGLAPSRALGQNFVVDANTVRRIARLAQVGPGDHVVEIGAGVGSLTLALAETGAEVTAIEFDRGLVEVLGEVLEGTGVTLVAHDARTLDWDALTASASRWVLVANLPYNIATPLICDLLDDVPGIDRMLVMVQSEVADRLVAGPGSDAYGIPSVKVAYWATARRVGSVGPDVFLPRPRVDSALVEIVRHPGGRPAVAGDPVVIFDLVRRAFGQRRKMLRRSLAGLVDAGGFEASGVDPESRPETLDLHAWSELSRVADPGR